MNKYKFGEFIYKRRKSLGLTQEDLGHKLGVTNKAVSKWETGETMPDLIMIESLARVLGVSIDGLITQNEFKPKNESKLKKAVIILSVLLSVALFTICSMIIPNLLKSNHKDEQLILDNMNCLDYLVVDPMESIVFTKNGGITLTVKTERPLNYELVSESIELSLIISIHTDGLNSAGNDIYYSFLDRDLSIELTDYVSKDEITVTPSSGLDMVSYMGLYVEFIVSSCSGTLLEVKR